MVMVDGYKTHIEKRYVLAGVWKCRESEQRLNGVGCGHYPTKAFPVGDHPGLLEGGLIPPAHHADDMVVAQGNVKIGGLEIFPTIAVDEAFRIVGRGKLLARIVAVQTIHDRRQ